jgi:hypothetical protein
MIRCLSYFLLLGAIAISCSPSQKKETIPADTKEKISDDSLFTLIQYRTFQYFWEGAESTSGAARERFHADDVYRAVPGLV